MFQCWNAPSGSAWKILKTATLRCKSHWTQAYFWVNMLWIAQQVCNIKTQVSGIYNVHYSWQQFYTCKIVDSFSTGVSCFCSYTIAPCLIRMLDFLRKVRSLYKDKKKPCSSGNIAQKILGLYFRANGTSLTVWHVEVGSVNVLCQINVFR